MPETHNGIGTWYYGKRRIHRRKGTCQACGQLTELESYDTTLYIVVFFVPLVPLGQKRIIEKCPRCTRHHALSLKKWEAVKSQNISELLNKLQANPDDRDTIIEALSLAVGYQDQPLFDKVAETLAQPRRDDAAIQTHLGMGYSYFARHAEAEAAYRAALASADTPETREALALALLRQNRPDDALPYLRHVFDQPVEENAGLLYLLIEAYQAEGMHQEALALMEQRDAAYPTLVGLSEYQKQRAFSLKHLQSGKKLRATSLSESTRTGYREGNWTARIPRLIGPVVLLGLLCWYLGAAIWIGQSRKVYLVNGWDRPYTVAINGGEHELRPGAALPIRIREGDVAIEFRDPAVPLDAVHCRIETGFFGRPFESPTFVINPDQLAVLIWEQAEYSANPRPDELPPRLHIGEILHTFEGIDYEFTPFPPTLQAKEGQRITKRRVSAATGLTSQSRWNAMSQALSGERQIDYCKRWLQLAPNDLYFLYTLLKQLNEQEAVAFLKTGLSVRPVRVEWHRLYQAKLERSHPEMDLRPEYRQLVTETKQQADALYLLARMEADAEADQLLRQAAAATPPSAYATSSLGFRALAQGDFPEAVRWTQRATELAPENPLFQQLYSEALLANRQHDQLIALAQKEGPAAGLALAMAQLRSHLHKRDKPAVQTTIAEAVRGLNDVQEKRIVQAVLEGIVCYHENDVAGYLRLAEQAPSPDFKPFQPPLLRGKLEEAAGLLNLKDNERALVGHALVYLAADKAGKQTLAGEHWDAFLACLGKGGRDERRLADILAGRTPVDAKFVLRMPVEPKQKRVLLTIAAQRFPAHRIELLKLAATLDFNPDADSLCLRTFWQ